MADTNYCTSDEVKQWLNIDDVNLDWIADSAIGAASRWVDGFCGRRFWQDDAVVPREYFPDSATRVYTDDISTLTGLVVKADIDLDGVFESTLVINNDFQPHPRNAALSIPVWPYTELVIVPVGSQAFFPRAMYGRASVQVTAKFGWPAVPDPVHQATIMQAARIVKRRTSPEGVAGFSDFGVVRVSNADRDVAELLRPFAHVAVG